MKRMCFNIFFTLSSLLYPLMVWYGLSYDKIIFLLWFFLFVFILRLLTLGLLLNKKKRTNNLISVAYISALFGVLLVLLSAFLKSYDLLLYYPVVVNVFLLLFFGFSLNRQPIIEQFARLQEPNLPLEAVRYTYKVTQVWCLFFIVNGGIALITVLHGNAKFWAFYNGFLSYILIALLIGIEWLIRKRVQRKIAEVENGSL